MHTKNQIKKVGIVSLGLIGGSLLKALSNKGYELYAVTRNPKTIEAAKTLTTNISDDLMTLSECDIVFVCSPMNKTNLILDALDKVVKKDAIVCDTASLKEFVMQKERSYIFVGSHPMAGTEHSGYEASFAELFEGANWVLTPSEKANECHIETIKNLIKKTGAITSLMNAQEHDKAVAFISHMPMLISQALVKTVMPNTNAVKLASSGFRDMTRLALSNTEMANDMITMNSQNIYEALILLIEETKSLLDENYSSEIEKIKNFRKNLYDCKGKNISNKSIRQ